jgi:hypothetical protein
MTIVKVHRDDATVGDLLAHADLLAEMASTEEELVAASRMQKAAAAALARAEGNRAVPLRDLIDQRFN